ncbi:MAG: hypothetical protein AB1422_07830 [bacterium]
MVIILLYLTNRMVTNAIKINHEGHEDHEENVIIQPQINTDK